MPSDSTPAAGAGTTRLRRRLWALALLCATAAAGQEELRPLRTGGLGAEAAALLLSGQEGGSIPLFALALPGIAEAGGKAPVELYVEASGPAILAGHESGRLRLELCFYAMAGSRVLDSSLETVELDLAQDRQPLLAGGVKSRSTLLLPAGASVVRVLVRNVETGELGLRSIAVEVPGADSGPLLQPLLAPDPPGGWLRLARDRRPPAAGFWPAARPVLAPRRDAELEVRARGLEPDLARLRLRGAGGESIEIPAAVSPAADPAPGALERWLVRARLPPLENGDYELSLRVGDAAASPELPIVVRQDGAGVWVATAAAPIAAPAPEPSLPGVADTPGPRRATAALAARLAGEYRAALDLVAAADLPGALAALARLETAAFDQEGGAGALASAEMDTARALAGTAGGTLVPLFELHYRAYRRYLAAQRFRLSSHARDLLLDLVDLHLARRPEDAGPAVDILAVMANELQQAGLARFSAVIFRRALDVDPSHRGALLGLAAGLEKRGEYRQACEMLEQLVKAHPDHREARLRLAVNLARSGHQARGRRLLGELTEDGGSDWILAVAYHELARDLIRRQRLDEAARQLGAGLERLPQDDQLRLLLAAVRDARRSGASDGGDLAIRSRADRPSARHRYQQWPRFTPGGDGDGSERRQALAAALQGLRGEA